MSIHVQINFFFYFAFKRYLYIDLLKQKKKKLASPPQPLWRQLYSHIHNHWGYFCDIVSLASCTIFFSHYDYTLLFSILYQRKPIKKEIIQWHAIIAMNYIAYKMVRCNSKHTEISVWYLLHMNIYYDVTKGLHEV